MATTEIAVPDIGDYSDVPVIEVHVSPGDVVAEEDPLVTLESDKATMDVPSPAAGTIGEVRLAVGEACARAVRMQERQGVAAPVTLEFGESGRFSVSVLDGAKTGSGDEISAVAGGDSPAAPWADPSGDSLGLALLGAVVQDLDVHENGEGGTRVTMSWPVA